MTRRIDSDALTEAQRALGVSGVSSGEAFWEDDSLFSVYDQVPIIRRSRADVATRGWFYGVHHTETIGGGGTEATFFLNIYEIGVANAQNTWPHEISNRFDVYLLGAFAQIISGTFNSGTDLLSLNVLPGGRRQAYGFSSGGGSPTRDPGLEVALFNQERITSTNRQMQDVTGRSFVPINLRMVPGQGLQTVMTVQGEVEMEVYTLLGLFPIALGQDVTV